MTTLGALFYADTRSFVNQLREIGRSPARALLWFLFGLLIGALIVMRVLRAAHGLHSRTPAASAAFSADVIICGGLILFGVALLFGDRYAGLFAHSAEARFIIGSRATPFVATLYVQVRQVFVGGLRQALGLIYLALLYLPSTLTASALTGDIALIAIAFLSIAAVPLARQLLAPQFVPVALVAGLACVAAGLVPLLHDAALRFTGDVPPLAPLLSLPAWHPGDVLLGGPNGGFAAIVLALAGGAATLFVAVARRAYDAYPELYELSMKRIARTERLRAPAFSGLRAPAGAPARGESMGAGAPAGVAIFVWRAWIEYRRTHGARATGLEAAALPAAGYAVARLTAVAHPAVIAAVVSPLVNIVFILAVIRSASLAGELRRPLFWLSGAPLFARLIALEAAQSLRPVAWCLLIAIGLAAGAASLLAFLATAVAAPAAVLLAGAIGYATYALLPHGVDQRGPLLFLRLLAGYVLLGPPVLAGIGAGLRADATIALMVAATVTLLEAAALLAFAARRLTGMSIALR